jgi:hypothetical protein
MIEFGQIWGKSYFRSENYDIDNGKHFYIHAARISLSSSNQHWVRERKAYVRYYERVAILAPEQMAHEKEH